ncbi:MAG: TlpA family protein disulfide reductase [SAR324 cluster bacterium]|nr:TlpA family protein disulfide reductase [SAR324 cluster bacterium]
MKTKSRMLAFCTGLTLLLFTTAGNISAASFPELFPLDTLEGKKLKKDELKGKWLVMVFWANWCIPCRKEVSQINELFTKWSAKGFQFVGINEDEDPKAARHFIKRYHPLYPNVEDHDFKFATRMKVQSLPMVLVLSAEGEILFRGIEAPSNEQLEQLFNRHIS